MWKSPLKLPKKLSLAARFILLAPALAQISAHAQTAPTNYASQALSFYQNRKFNQSADAFELAMRGTTPEPRLYYYAALANKEARRLDRAKQILAYICKYFAKSAEGPAAVALLRELDPGNPLLAESGTSSTAATAIANTTANAAAKTTNITTAKSATAKSATANIETAKEAKVGSFPFTPEDIARQGAHGIDQSHYPNCWFQASMSALAQLPKGQKLLASMIRVAPKGKYVVRFPGDGKEYLVSEEDIEEAGITDKALWAGLLECAQIRKFPMNAGAEGTNGDQSRLEVGMGCITGCKAQLLDCDKATDSDITSFIGGALRSGDPVVCGTYGDYNMENKHPLVFPAHAYTIIGLDASRGMITIRNPHGAGSRRFSLPSDPKHLQFEQEGDGVSKIHVKLFQEYFHSIARSFI